MGGPVVFAYQDLADPDADLGAQIEEVRGAHLTAARFALLPLCPLCFTARRRPLHTPCRPLGPAAWASAPSAGCRGTQRLVPRCCRWQRAWRHCLRTVRAARGVGCAEHTSSMGHGMLGPGGSTVQGVHQDLGRPPCTYPAPLTPLLACLLQRWRASRTRAAASTLAGAAGARRWRAAPPIRARAGGRGCQTSSCACSAALSWGVAARLWPPASLHRPCPPPPPAAHQLLRQPAAGRGRGRRCRARGPLPRTGAPQPLAHRRAA